jgi:queuine tRNA-ribosyltransferase subunit QTRTD1
MQNISPPCRYKIPCCNFCVGNSQSAKNMNFTRSSTSPHQTSIGQLSVNGVTHETPNYIVYTRRGTVPHLTNDNLKLVLESSGHESAIMNVNLWEMLPNFSSTLLEKYNNSLHQFLNFKREDNYTLLLTIRDSLYAQQTQLTNDRFIMGDTESGRKKLDVTQFIQHVKSYNTDIFVAMHDSSFGTGSGEPAPLLKSDIPKKRISKALDRTTKWLQQQKQSSDVNSIMFGGVVLHDSVITKSIDLLDTKGIALGDFSSIVPSERYEFLGNTVKYIREKKDVNTVVLISGQDHPYEILECVSNGVDLFDGTYPFTCAENGYASIYPVDINDKITPEEHDKLKMNLRDVKYARQFIPINSSCSCFSCKNHTRAYIHHLLNTHEMLAEVLLSIHNLHQYLSLFRSIRNHIKNGTFNDLKQYILSQQ